MQQRNNTSYIPGSHSCAIAEVLFLGGNICGRLKNAAASPGRFGGGRGLDLASANGVHANSDSFRLHINNDTTHTQLERESGGGDR